MSPNQDEFFVSYYQTFFNKLYSQAYSDLRNRSVAEELVQETFCVAWSDYETFRCHENPKAYLKQILRYKISEYNRSRQRYLKIFLSYEDASLRDAKAPSNSIPTSTSSILEIARSTLTEEEWYILKRFTLDGASHSEIAEALGIAITTSYKRLERIRKKLEDVLPDF